LIFASQWESAAGSIWSAPGGHTVLVSQWCRWPNLRPLFSSVSAFVGPSGASRRWDLVSDFQPRFRSALLLFRCGRQRVCSRTVSGPPEAVLIERKRRRLT